MRERLYYVPHRRAHVGDWLVASLQSLGEPAWVLDFGGGTGQMASGLMARLGAHVVVADVDGAALAHVPRDADLQPVLIPPLPPLPFSDAAFAAIVLMDVLHHVTDRAGTLAELARCLRPGGVLAIVEFEPQRPATRLFRNLARLVGRRCTFETRKVVTDRLVRLDLSVTSKSLDSLRYGVVARRNAATTMYRQER